MSRLDDIASLQRESALAYVHPAVAAGWDPAKDPRFSSLATEGFDQLRATCRISKRIVAALVAEDARVLLGTDALNPFTIPGFSIHEELRLFVEAGLTPYQAIRAGTYAAADFLGVLNEFGTVTEGRRADLILLDANPLDDVAHIAHPAAVMARGTWLPAEKLTTMLAAAAAAYRDVGTAT